MSILLYDFKQLTECISEVERIEARVNNRRSRSKKGIGLTKKEEEVPAMNSTVTTITTLDRWY
jgi:hypothetical protein